LPQAQASLASSSTAAPVDASRRSRLLARTQWAGSGLVRLLAARSRSRPAALCGNPSGNTGLICTQSPQRFQSIHRICSANIDQHRYSLRTANQDLGGSFRLRPRQVQRSIAAAGDEPRWRTKTRSCAGARPPRDAMLRGRSQLEVQISWGSRSRQVLFREADPQAIL